MSYENKTEDQFDYADISHYKTYTLQEMKDLLESAYNHGVEKGWTDVRLSVESRMEPYEAWPGDAALVVHGTREMNSQEIEEVKHQNAVQEYAEEMGITFYEAGILLRLKDRGVL